MLPAAPAEAIRPVADRVPYFAASLIGGAPVPARRACLDHIRVRSLARGDAWRPRTKTLLAVLLGTWLLAAAGCGGGPTLTPVIVDTDMSTDDVVALLYVASSPEVDLRAVTVSGTGLTTCPVGARNALRLLALAGRPDVPVACGRDEPLAGPNQFPVEWRSRADSLFGLELPQAARRPQGTAVELLERVLTLAPRSVTVLSLAPLTDSAALLRARPALARKIARIVAMGGAVDVPGNIGPEHEKAEYNIWIDPVAAQEVLAAGVPTTLVPLDATNDVPTTVFFSEALRRFHYATPAATAAWELFVQNPSVWSGGQYFWDPLAAAAVTTPALLDYRDEKLRVVSSLGPRDGDTVRSHTGMLVRVAVAANRPAFERELLGTLLGGASFTIPKQGRTAAITFDGDACTYRGPSKAQAGQVAFDTVNSSGRSFRHVVVDGTTGAPEVQGETPPHSRMTWVAYLGSGTKTVSCSFGGRTAVAATVTLSGAR